MTILLSLLRPYWSHILAITSTALCAFLLTRPSPVPIVTTKTEFVDKVVDREVIRYVDRDVVKYRDRIVNRTITKPGGTTIVETIKEVGGQSNKSTEVEAGKEHDTFKGAVTTITVLPAAPKFLLSVNLYPGGSFYSSSAGIRIHNTVPLYLGAGIMKVDTSYKPFLSLGVIF